MIFIANSPTDLPAIALKIVETAAPRRIFTLTGEMGAGKTTFVAAAALALGIEEAVSSPTYSIVQEYVRTDGRLTVLHFDLYRLKSLEEALDIGFEDLLDRPEVYVFIEWSAIVAPLLPPDTVHISISADGELRTRRIEVA